MASENQGAAKQLTLDEVFDGPSAGASTAERSQQDYRVNLPSFEGPLDLLLHLIRKDQVDIYDIPISKICSSYLEYVDRMVHPDMNVAGEFMVMAATLMHIKSQLLLPKDEDEEAEDDPRVPLVAQLLEYERFQRAAQELDLIPWLGRDVFARPQAASKDLIPHEALMDAPIDPLDPYALLMGLKVAMDRTEKPTHNVESDTTSLREKVEEMGTALDACDVSELSRFIPERPVRLEIIVAFLSVLELTRLKFIEIIQTENFGPIQIRRVRSLSELNVALLDTF